MGGWQPLSGHVSQLRRWPDGSYSGADDCGPACCVRYLMEAGRIAPTLDVLPLFEAFREYIDGHPDEEYQSGTTASDLERYLASFGIRTDWTLDYAQAEEAAFSIVLIAAPPLLADGTWPYPASWLGGQDHWILWLRQWRGAINWFDDPLTYEGGERDTQLDLGYLPGIFAGAILLPDVPTAPQPQRRTSVLAACALKVQPNHTCTALARIPAGGQVLDLGDRRRSGDEIWSRVQWRDRDGWCLAANLAAS